MGRRHTEHCDLDMLRRQAQHRKERKKEREKTMEKRKQGCQKGFFKVIFLRSGYLLPLLAVKFVNKKNNEWATILNYWVL